MGTFSFTVVVTLPAPASFPAIEARLVEAGCSDALVGLGRDRRIALRFTREAASLSAAVASALADVKRGVPDAVAIQVN